MTRAANTLKKPTNVTIRSDLLDEARALNINLSQEFETHLAAVVRRHRAEQWLKDNREAIAAYNRFFKEQGLWSDEYRTW
jgi:antitoxin CcdA